MDMKERLQAVSYTHLIVYKRNTHNTSIEKMEVFLCLKTDMEKKEKSLKQG